MEFYYVTQVDLEIIMLEFGLELVKLQRSACLCLWSDAFKGMQHYTQLHEIL